MKSIFFTLVLLPLLCAYTYGQSKEDQAEMRSPIEKITYQQWKEEAFSDIRLLPKFGSVNKNEEQIEADKQLIDYLVKQHGSRRKGSEELVNLGFQYLRKGDPQTAMYRFNQAWTLDAKNENAFWGFATVYFNFDDYPLAMQQLNEGLALNPKNSAILTDKATIHLMFAQADGNEKELATAVQLFNQSYSIDPKNPSTLLKLSALYLMQGDCKKALKYYKECKARGVGLISKAFAEAIESSCGVKEGKY